MQEASPVPAARGAYYPALDGLRALALLLVFYVHYATMAPPLWGWGWIGVDIFFVLSGFLITGILYDSRGRTHALRDFYMRRVLRIFPLYYFVWFAFLVTIPLLHWSGPSRVILWPLYLGNYAGFIPFHPHEVFKNGIFVPYIHGRPTTPVAVSHYWSLCVEEQFYLVWPFVVLYASSRRNILRVITFFLVVTPVLRVVIAAYASPELLWTEILYRATFTRIDALLWGALLAMLVRINPAVLHRYGRAITISSAGTMFAYMVFRSVADPVKGSSLVSNWNMTLGLVLIDVFGFGLVLELIREKSLLGKLFTWTPARRLGQISYGFYVIHYMPIAPLSSMLDHVLPRAVLANNFLRTCCVLVTAFLFSFVAAKLSYRFLEQPFLRLKNRFPGQTHTAPAS